MDTNNRGSVKSGLENTQTEQNLKKGFEGEANAYTKYKLFAQQARKEGLPVIAKQFDDIADNEMHHAEMWLGYTNGLGTTDQNLREALADERRDGEINYPEFAKQADKEGFGEIAEKFRLTAQTENTHANTYSNILNEREDNGNSTGEVESWECVNCGYRFEGDTLPERCPLCSYPREYMRKNNMA